MRRRLSIRIMLGWLAVWAVPGFRRRSVLADEAAGGVSGAAGADLEAGAMGGPWVVAHRGASGLAPENTLAAFRKAWELGADAVEGDFWMTADGEIVCLHDRTLERTAGVELDVTTASMADLADLEVGAWKGEAWSGEPVPTLAEVVACVPDGKRFFLEIKDGPRAVPRIREVLRAEAATRPIEVRLIAFDEDVVRACREHLPECPVHWLVGAKTVAGRGVGTIVETARGLGAAGLGVDVRSDALAELGAGLEAAGLELHVWTVNDEGLARGSIEAGTASITTDFPDRVRRWLPRPEAEPVGAADAAGVPAAGN